MRLPAALACLMLVSCEPPQEPAPLAKDRDGLTLTAQQIEKLGLTTRPAVAVSYRAESQGFGVVLEHQLIAQAVADAQTAQAAARLSKTSLDRARGLHGTPGAIAADLEQTAEQKMAVDTTAVTLSTEKLTAVWGMAPPWKSDIHDSRVQALAHGTVQLVRATFPLGVLSATPGELHVSTLSSSASATLRVVWPAPADANIPGRSFFALLPAGTAAEGERLQVGAPAGKATPGTLVPSAAMVLSAGQYWCYIENRAGAFSRVAVDTNRPTSGGYVVTDGVKPGDPIVVSAAAQLLAEEAGSSADSD